LGLSATVSATPVHARVGNSIEVVVSVLNNYSYSVSTVRLDGAITVAGTGGVSSAGARGPTMVPSLAPGTMATFTNLYTATNEGTVSFTAAATGIAPKGVVTSTVATATVNIAPNGDLLIKRAIESADLYAGLGVFQTVPIPPQVKTNIVTSTNDVSIFQVQIQNNDPHTRIFTLQAKEGGNPVWKRAFLLSGADVTAQLEVPGGATLPAMAPGTALTLTVTLQDTNASPGDLNSAEFILGLASDPTLTLDAVQAFTRLVPVIVVNSTADLPLLDTNGCCCDTGRKLTNGVAECTLRAAIQLANRDGLKDLIKFQIPASDPGIVNGVPSIQPQTALPDLTASMVIDGWSQSSSASRPPVELSGIDASPRGPSWGKLLDGIGAERVENLIVNGVPNGLHVVAEGCEIRGLVINGFPSCGILVDGSDTIVQGDYLGIDPSGTLSEPNGKAPYGWPDSEQAIRGAAGGAGAQLCLRSPGNVVGGGDVHSGNVIAGGPNVGHSLYWVGPPGLVILGGAANGNVVEGNIIGLDASASHLPFMPQNLEPVSGLHGSGQYVGVWISDGSGNRVGGSAAGNGNLIAGNLQGVYITGDSASGNVIAGNQIGWSAGYTPDANAQGAGVYIRDSRSRQNTVGGSAPGAGNIIGGTEVGINDGGVSDTIQGNWIGVQADGKTAIRAQNGIFVGYAQSSLVSYNTIANIGSVGILIEESTSSRVFGNQVSSCDDHGIKLLFNCQGSVISLNTIFGNGHRIGISHGNGIYKDLNVERGAVTISQNSIRDSDGLGIGFNEYGTPSLNSVDLQPIRMLFARPPPVYANGQLQITGTLEGAIGGGTYLLEFFGNDRANPSGYGEGQTFLGSTAVTVGLLGIGDISVTLPCPKNPGQYLTATATAPDGNTTEFSRAVLIQPCTPGIKGICPGIETNVPSLTGASGHIRPMALSFGDGNGDGIQDWLQSNVASLPSFPGLWVTLAAPGGTVLENVTPTAVPDYSSLPSGYIFPIGFLSFGITNLPAGGSVTITNFLHLDADPGFAYAATTYFNFGSTPDNHTPHWYEFLFNGTNGVELLPDRIILHLRDGARGDHDVSINGEIVTLGAPAYRLPPAPQLAISLVSVGSSNIVDVLEGTNGTFSLVTNPVPVVTCVLSWPTNANNYVLGFRYGLSSQNLFDGLPAPVWQTVPQTPVIVNGRNYVTNTTINSTGFYRLSPNAVVATASGPVLLSVQLTGTNTILFSWPASASGFGLQQNSDLDATKWVNVTNAVSVVGGDYQVIASPIGGRRFYRLQAQ
jgi:parallel beta-helix repeat protein